MAGSRPSDLYVENFLFIRKEEGKEKRKVHMGTVSMTSNSRKSQDLMTPSSCHIP